VVVGVQKGQRLLLEEKEAGVDEFDVFGQVVQLNPDQRFASDEANSGTRLLT
jgi:hypothetical protein